MSTRTTVTLAIAAGFIGGIISQRIAPVLVFAQAPTPAAKEIRAEKFVIVDEDGSPRGAFGIRDKDGWPIVEVVDKEGNVWVARMAGERFFGKGKPFVVPAR